MKLLYILLILTITINYCYSISVGSKNNGKEINIKPLNNVIDSYTMVSYSDKKCQNEDTGIGFTFPNSISNEPMMFFDDEGETDCGVITTSPDGIKIEWYFNEFNCTSLPLKPDTVEIYKVGECKYSVNFEDYYLLTDTRKVDFAENTLKIQPTLISDESKCGTVQEGFFLNLLNSTEFGYTRSFVTYTDLYFCDQESIPYHTFCVDGNCSTTSLSTDCAGPFNFVYSCFGSSSSN